MLEPQRINKTGAMASVAFNANRHVFGQPQAQMIVLKLSVILKQTKRAGLC